MAKRKRTDALAHLSGMRSGDPGLQAEYERLGPRFELIDGLIRARKRAGFNQGELARRMGRSQAYSWRTHRTGRIGEEAAEWGAP